jgi:hypothetical protein
VTLQDLLNGATITGGNYLPLSRCLLLRIVELSSR